MHGAGAGTLHLRADTELRAGWEYEAAVAASAGVVALIGDPHKDKSEAAVRKHSQR